MRRRTPHLDEDQESKKPDVVNTSSQKAVKLNDSFNTIIYIDKKENEDKAIQKYLKDLEDYHLNNTRVSGKLVHKQTRKDNDINLLT